MRILDYVGEIAYSSDMLILINNIIITLCI